MIESAERIGPSGPQATAALGHGLRADGLYRTVGKRAIDLCLTVPLSVLLSPWLALTALLVRLDSRGPALFVQERLGRGGRAFRIYKFRTMTHRQRTTHREVLVGDPEVTRIGYWLRRFKIDELPQLVNVLTGDMSLVGPRPGLTSDLENYGALGRRRLLVRPGLTGLAQVHGNIHLSWERRWRYDALYVKRCSLALDAWILWRTVAVVLQGEDRFLKPRMPEAQTEEARR